MSISSCCSLRWLHSARTNQLPFWRFRQAILPGVVANATIVSARCGCHCSKFRMNKYQRDITASTIIPIQMWRVLRKKLWTLACVLSEIHYDFLPVKTISLSSTINHNVFWVKRTPQRKIFQLNAWNSIYLKDQVPKYGKKTTKELLNTYVPQSVAGQCCSLKQRHLFCWRRSVCWVQLRSRSSSLFPSDQPPPYRENNRGHNCLKTIFNVICNQLKYYLERSTLTTLNRSFLSVFLKCENDCWKLKTTANYNVKEIYIYNESNL